MKGLVSPTQTEYSALVGKYKDIRKDVDWGKKFRLLVDVLHRPGSVIARDIGISIVTWKSIVTHVNTPSLIILVEICNHFHINYDWLIDNNLNGDILLDRNRVRDSNDTIAERVLEIKGRDNIASFMKKTGLSYTVHITLKQNAKNQSSSTNLKSFPDYSARIVSEASIRKIADAYNVGFEWLLCGDGAAKENPVNDKMISFLWSRPEIRKTIWDEIGHRYDNIIENSNGSDIEQLDKLYPLLHME